MAKPTQWHFWKAWQLPRRACADSLRVADNSLCNCETGAPAPDVRTR